MCYQQEMSSISVDSRSTFHLYQSNQSNQITITTADKTTNHELFHATQHFPPKLGQLTGEFGGKKIPHTLIHELAVGKEVVTHGREPLLLERLQLHHLVESAARRSGITVAAIGVEKLATAPVLTKASGEVHARPPAAPAVVEVGEKGGVVDGAAAAVEGEGAENVLLVAPDWARGGALEGRGRGGEIEGAVGRGNGEFGGEMRGREGGFGLVEEESVGAEGEAYHLLLPQVLNQNVAHDFGGVLRIQILDPRHHHARRLRFIHHSRERKSEIFSFGFWFS